jgi:hypothetical protein
MLFNPLSSVSGGISTEYYFPKPVCVTKKKHLTVLCIILKNLCINKREGKVSTVHHGEKVCISDKHHASTKKKSGPKGRLLSLVVKVRRGCFLTPLRHHKQPVQLRRLHAQ